MATSVRERRPGWTRRILEWSMLSLVLLILMGLLGRRIHEVQGQAELASIKSTVGALRTAFVINHLKHSLTPDGQAVVLVQRNPFDLLERRPTNYAGEARGAAMGRSVDVPAGSWFFDPDCICVGYLPAQGEWLVSPNGNDVVWLQVSDPPAPFQLRIKEAYVWQGQKVD